MSAPTSPIGPDEGDLDLVVVIGTKGPFPRLLDAVAAWARRAPGRRAWVQHGESARPDGVDGAPIVPRAELARRLARARAVVVHGGSGAIRDALAAGVVPVVAPRRAAHGEHVNDHQDEIARALGDRVVVLREPEDPAAFAAAVELARARTDAQRGQPVTLPGASLRAAVGERLRAVRPSRRAPLVWWALSLVTRHVTPRRR